MFPYLGRLLLLHLALFEQQGCPLGSSGCSRLGSLIELRCFALHSLLVACLCLCMKANEISFEWVFLPLEGEQSVDRGPLVCWVDLNFQLFCSQDVQYKNS